MFNRECRIFAPRYRQTQFVGFVMDPKECRGAFELSYSDVKRAFEYYIVHYNDGRPFFLASHSQGQSLHS